MADTLDSSGGIFEPVTLDRVADAVVEQIERLIITGVLAPGQKLPPERELAEAMGVSRPKLREAFQILSERGLVEIRRSEGAFIRLLGGPAPEPAIVELFARHRSAFLDFVEYRREQEGFAAHLAARRATDDDTETLGQIVAMMETATRDGDRAREGALDLRFHRALVEAAHNAILVHAMRPIYALMEQTRFYDRRFLYDKPGAGTRLLDQHRAIAEAVFARDPAAAAEAATAHLDFVAATYCRSEDEARRIDTARKRRRIGFSDMPVPAPHLRQQR